MSTKRKNDQISHLDNEQENKFDFSKKGRYNDREIVIKSKEDPHAQPSEAALQNPHTLQYKQTYYREFKPELRTINEDTLSAKYERRSGYDKTTIHFGQRKLLLSEVEFLTRVTHELHAANNRNPVVLVYAGAAPGHHTPMLTWMFPFVREFVLVDPAKFELDEKKMRCKHRILRECFTDEMATELRDEFAKDNCEILLVSDIRTADHRKLSSETTELRVEDDMQMQMKWHDIMKPFKSMFKFRLPYVGENNSNKMVEYLDGDIYFQTWEGKTSSETRLIVDRNSKRKQYDCSLYENWLFRFNTVERVLCYQHEVKAPGLDHCYDCRAEVHIFDEFVKAKSKISDLCEWRDLGKYEPEADGGLSVESLVLATNMLLNASRKTDAVKLTLNGKSRLYSVLFTDVEHGVDIKKLFNDDKVVHRQNVKYNSSDEEQEDPDRVEKHITECVSIHTLECKQSEYRESGFDEFGKMRVLTDTYREKIKPKERYEFIDRTTMYYKERSLRLREIEFLSMACSEAAERPDIVGFSKKVVLVYAGAGPSRQLDKLHEMFPFVKIIVFEPRKFYVNTSEMLELRQEYLTEMEAFELKEKYNNYVRLFISNIKRADNYGSANNTKLEKEDLSLQMTLHQNLQPFKSMLRFRLPYPDSKLGTKDEFNYLNGTILFNLWSHNAQMDATLIADANSGIRSYSYIKFKNQLYRFNTFERCQLYKHNVNARGLDHCYDCRGEIYVFELYESKRKKMFEYFGLSQKEKSEKSAENWISDLNDFLEANKKFINIQFNKRKYNFIFTDVCYGKTLNDMLKAGIIRESIDNFNRYKKSTNVFDRLDFSTVRTKTTN